MGGVGGFRTRELLKTPRKAAAVREEKEQRESKGKGKGKEIERLDEEADVRI